MKLSRHMRANLNLIPDEGETPAQGRGRIFYASQLDPLTKRGLVEWSFQERQVTIRVPIARLTDLGRRVKMQNSDD